MSTWTRVTGVLTVNEMTENEFLRMFDECSSYLVGSEGGISVDFVRKNSDDDSLSVFENCNVAPFPKITNVVLSGNLRDFTAEKIEEAKIEIEEFLVKLKSDKYSWYKVLSASIIMRTTDFGYYTTFDVVGNNVVVREIEIEEEDYVEYEI